MLGRNLPAFGADPAASLRSVLTDALRLPDVARVRDLVQAAHDHGQPADEMFVESVRPALRDAMRSWPPGQRRPREQLALKGLSTIFAGMAAADEELGNGAGRRALVVGEAAGADGLDTQVLVELLEHAGWMITTLSPDHADAEPLLERLEPAAIVLVGESAGRQAWPRLRNALGDGATAPLVVLCRFDAELPPVAAADGEGIDALVSRPAAALALLRDRFAQASLPAWGVVLRRELNTLVVTPSGRLDAETAARLRRVVESRAGSFEHLVLNLRDLSAFDERTLGETLRWVRENGWQAPDATTAPPA